MAAAPHLYPAASSGPVIQVEISVSCRNLKNKDALSKSDPMAVLFVKETGQSDFREIGRTEVVHDTINPDFVTKFVVNYYFEVVQKLKFAIYDSDSSSIKLSTHDFLGQFECTLGELVSSTKLDKPLVSDKDDHRGHHLGSIVVRSEEVSKCRELLRLKFNATKLDKKDLLGKSDPFLVFYKCNEDNSYTAVHKTEVVKKNLNPSWSQFMISLQAMCNGDYDRSVKIECYDWDSDGSSHDLIGACQTTAKELVKGTGTFELVNPKSKSSKKGYVNSGVLHLESCFVEVEHTFLDYIQSGVQLNFTVAIDFTQSNGNPANPSSLHYIDPYGLNQYATALLAIGGVVQDYDSDKQFPALGFGAKLPNGQVSHEFFLTGTTSPFCAGISGVLQAYQTAIRTVELWGPTNFSPVINHVAKFAAAIQNGSNYFILLIITDGVITDLPQTKTAIVEASFFPMSIIIVGVGNADFSAMEELDADKRQLSSNGKVADRDIVQFVPLRDYTNTGSPELTQARLAKEVLAEVPQQLLAYMRKRRISPLRPPAGPPPS